MIMTGKTLFLTLLLFLTACFYSSAASYEDFLRLVRKGNIIVTKDYDLSGHDVVLPQNARISFSKQGHISNGRIIGNKSSIDGATHSIGITLAGTWVQQRIDDTFFDWDILDDKTIINNIEALQSDTVYNTVVLNKDYLLSVEKENGSCINPSSNSTYIIQSSIRLIPNSFPSYSIILVKRKQNVTITGNGVISGDVGRHQYIPNSSSEWGFGIMIMESSKILIEGLTITKCIGDGIYISGGNEASIGSYVRASRDIVIRNMVCDDNRRQGISVIHVDGLLIANCTLCNTGKTEFTKPGAGIDIEPNTSNNRNMSVRNVEVNDCYAFGNAQYDFVTSGCVYDHGVYNFENVTFSKCRSQGMCYFTSPVIMSESEVGSVKLLGYEVPIDVIIRKTTINEGLDFHCPRKRIQLESGKRIINSLSLEECILNFGSSPKSKYLFRTMSGNMENVGSITVSRSVVNASTHEPFVQLCDRAVFSLQLIDSEINMPGMNLLPQNARFIHSKIKCASINGGKQYHSKQFDTCDIVLMDTEKKDSFLERVRNLFK